VDPLFVETQIPLFVPDAASFEKSSLQDTLVQVLPVPGEV
jgi:hypothetical protein